ncbi:MAG: threonylcarbamoyl-AMP synthase [Betaproteobacteria bacterium]|nr:threonylcarbamoyl-AMP synthase [Betaproteobacteria bacterium]MBI2291744.1 threonylcarbamoyl-AMP synthase [Betaproteobacteria bacterium]MBI3054247.1 threonylcarbamoyl-AMP synthase [Betaproteobacteria bacterium]
MVSDPDIDNAVAILRRGGLVAFPTETVYGLGADARNPEALGRLYAAKGRPAGHPVIVHLADVSQLAQWARELPPAAVRLAARFWPGPLTLILPRAPAVSDAVTGGQDTVGLRIPSHPVAHALLTKFGSGVAAPSANRFGRVSATTAQHVKQEFGDAIDLVLEGGPSEIGIESTIVAVTGERPVLLRPGHIPAREIEQAAGVPLGAPDTGSPRAPGTLAAHYAPQTPLIVMEGDLLLELAASLTRQGKRVAVLAHGTLQPLFSGLTWIVAPPDAPVYAHDLYANLRALDAAECDAILVEKLPQQPEWDAVNDRLGRAAAGSSPTST